MNGADLSPHHGQHELLSKMVRALSLFLSTMAIAFLIRNSIDSHEHLAHFSVVFSIIFGNIFYLVLFRSLSKKIASGEGDVKFLAGLRLQVSSMAQMFLLIIMILARCYSIR